jgi:hypothetical protein
MPVNVRPVTVKGQQQLLVTIDGGISFTIRPDTAWMLAFELRWNLMTIGDTPPDDPTDGY